MFKTRLLSGIVLTVIALVVLGLGGPLLAAVLLAISLIAYRELAQAMKQEKGLLGTIGMAGVAVYYLLMYFTEQLPLMMMAIVGVFMAMMFAYVITFPRYRSENVVSSFFCFMYAPVMLSFLYLTRNTEQGNYMVWLILISSWVCDTSAYAVGMLIGKKKIFPVLSPKKSLEGCIGGVVGSALVGALYGALVLEKVFPDRTVVWSIAFICAAGAVMSQVGDLAASAIKRNYEIKDYGKLIPGHGGIMDRFDSVIVTAPLIYFLTYLLLG